MACQFNFFKIPQALSVRVGHKELSICCRWRLRKGSEDIFFSPKTEFISTNFESLNIDDKVKVDVIETERGLFACNLALVS